MIVACTVDPADLFLFGELVVPSFPKNVLPRPRGRGNVSIRDNIQLMSSEKGSHQAIKSMDFDQSLCIAFPGAFNMSMVDSDEIDLLSWNVVVMH
jgi:hypothetical protein